MDSAWEAEFYEIHGRHPTDQDRRDRLFSVMNPGSGPNGAWTSADWKRYGSQYAELWSGDANWLPNESRGLGRFAVRIGRLASYYADNETDEFVKAFAFVYGNVPMSFPLIAMIRMTPPLFDGTMNAYPLLDEGTHGWNPTLVEDSNDNPAHHYAGLFYAGYWNGPQIAIFINHLRDGALSGTNEPDLLLGDLAAQHGANMAVDRLTMRQLSRIIKESLAP